MSKITKSNMAIKYRIYPNTSQAIMFAKTFGCCRKIWNLMKADRDLAYQELELLVTKVTRFWERQT